MFAASNSAKAAAAAKDPYFPYVPLLLETTSTNGQQNNTFLDSSTNNFTITRSGTTTQGSVTPYWPNGQWGNYFDFNGSYLSYGSSSLLSFGTGDFTVEAWIYVISVGTRFDIFGTGGSSTGSYGLYVYPSSGNKIVSTRYGDTAGSGTTTNAISLNTWVHVAAVRSGGTAYVYVNGVADSGATYAMGAVTNTGSTTGFTFNTTCTGTGYVSNLRVVKGVAVYTGTFTPPTSPLQKTQSSGTNISAITGTQTSLLTCQSNRFLDNSTNNFTITTTGTPRVQAFQPFSPAASYTTAAYGGSGYFNGTSDYLSLTPTSAFNFSTNNWTIEMWLNLNTVSAQQVFLCFGYEAGTQRSFILYLTSSNVLQFAFSTNGSNNTDTSLGASGFTVGTWNHLAIVRNGATITAYRNGVAYGTTISIGASSINYTPGAFRIGLDSINYANGYISNLRIVNGTAVYTGAFTPPTSPLTAITNTSLLLNFTNAGIYDAAAQNNLITVGDAQSSTTQYKWSPTSMKFDGTGDYLEPVTTPALTLGTSNFTIEGWIYFNSVASFQIMYDQRPPSTNGVYPVLYMNGAVMTWFINGVAQITSGSLSAGVWYYFAVTRSSSVTKMFINGSQVGSNYSDTNNYLAARTIIGISSYDFLFGINGYLQDFRITKGVGRTITTPTAAFPTR
jgi:hypothetical protein